MYAGVHTRIRTRIRTGSCPCKTGKEIIHAVDFGGEIYMRQEGNGLGEVSKFLVHNARASLGDSVDNFITLCGRNYYDGVIFHRLIRNFVHEQTSTQNG